MNADLPRVHPIPEPEQYYEVKFTAPNGVKRVAYGWATSENILLAKYIRLGCKNITVTEIDEPQQKKTE